MYCDVMCMRATLDTGVEFYIILKLSIAKNPRQMGGSSGIRPPQLTGTMELVRSVDREGTLELRP